MNSPGMVLNGRYQLLSELGSGGSGNVFLALDVYIEKKWAVKFIPYEKTMSERLARNEQEFMKSLDHPAFPRIVDAFYTGEGFFIVSDYIEGSCLNEALRKRAIPLRKKCGYALSVLEALEYLHSQQPPILYLDLKPENVMLTKDDQIRLIDFGVATRKREAEMKFGTPGFAAPELYRGEGNGLDERTDIFSFGMLFYSMLSLSPPNKDLNIERRLIRSNNSIPKSLRKLILRCTGREKSFRYQNVREVRKELTAYLNRPKRSLLMFLLFLSIAGLFMLFWRRLN
ncbi:MAG: serine/threonine protein kinase [Lachnospiraceae bacterium]|nr:serine/threonine protein kinase [Lachnospiraceae bacterium]